MKLIAGKMNIIRTLVKPGYAEGTRPQPKYKPEPKPIKEVKIIRRDFTIGLVGRKEGK